MSIYEKISRIQNNLMSKEFKSTALDTLLPHIFEEYYKQNICLFFTFVENTGILKIKEWNGSSEINVRLYTEELVKFESIKEELLVNTFLITSTPSSNVENLPIVEDNVTPKPIREAQAYVKKRGVPVTQASLENYFRNHNPLKDMDKDTRKQVLDYLRGMKK